MRPTSCGRSAASRSPCSTPSPNPSSSTCSATQLAIPWYACANCSHRRSVQVCSTASLDSQADSTPECTVHAHRRLEETSTHRPRFGLRRTQLSETTTSSTRLGLRTATYLVDPRDMWVELAMVPAGSLAAIITQRLCLHQRFDADQMRPESCWTCLQPAPHVQRQSARDQHACSQCLASTSLTGSSKLEVPFRPSIGQQCDSSARDGVLERSCESVAHELSSSSTLSSPRSSSALSGRAVSDRSSPSSAEFPDQFAGGRAGGAACAVGSGTGGHPRPAGARVGRQVGVRARPVAAAAVRGHSSTPT